MRFVVQSTKLSYAENTYVEHTVSYKMIVHYQVWQDDWRGPKTAVSGWRPTITVTDGAGATKTSTTACGGFDNHGNIFDAMRNPLCTRDVLKVLSISIRIQDSRLLVG